jgi:NhaP-type Na+/H+ or K+/H+ antiporter
MDPMGLGALFGSITTFVVVGAVVQTFWVSVGAAVGAFVGGIVGWVIRRFARKPAVAH